jgi:hypothetical protein
MMIIINSQPYNIGETMTEGWSSGKMNIIQMGFQGGE